jgi:hypothetical protein
MSKRDELIKWIIVGIFVALYGMVSIISTIHVIDFFRLSNPEWLAVTLSIAFEVGAAACLGAIVILNRTSRWLVWALFILITGMQMMGNMYYAYSHLQDYKNWIELFGLQEEDPIYQKRILSIISGAILPIVALGFIKSLVDYIRPSDYKEESTKELIDEDQMIEEFEYASLKDLETFYEEESKEIEMIEETEEPIEDLEEIEETIEIKENPFTEDKIEEEIKSNEVQDKYTKIESSPIANINAEKRTFGPM